jgi:hypothetical protein
MDQKNIFITVLCVKMSRVNKAFKKIQLIRLCSNNKHRMEIGSGTLKMALDVQLEERVTFWSKIW